MYEIPAALATGAFGGRDSSKNGLVANSNTVKLSLLARAVIITLKTTASGC